MAEHADEKSFEPQEPVGPETAPDASPPSEVSESHAAYLKIINNAKKVVAIAIVIFGAGFIICVNRDDYLTETLRREPGIWAWGIWICGLGVIACLIATLALIVEFLARPISSASFKLRSVFIRSLFIVTASIAICLLVVITFGPWQAVGTMIGTFLLLAALREKNMARVVLAVLAMIALSLTLLSTQSAYQYARRHADEIVAAGNDLMEQWPETRQIQESSFDDSHVPSVLRKLGARSILIDKEHVVVDANNNIKFNIYRIPISTSDLDVLIGDKGSTATKITDRLVMIAD